jgi:hypothetical protein
VTLLGTQAFDDAWDSVLSSYEKPSGGLLTSSERAEIIGHMKGQGFEANADNWMRSNRALISGNRPT